MHGSEGHYKLSSEYHYTYVADFSSDLHWFVITVYRHDNINDMCIPAFSLIHQNVYIYIMAMHMQLFSV